MRTLSLLTLLCVLMGGGSAQALTYGLAALSNGSTALVAEGRIHRSDATRLLSLVQGRAMPSTLVISSPGGELVGALAVGETLRRFGIRTVVGSITADVYGNASIGPGRCHSACVFVLMGGTARFVVPGSLVGVHSPQPVMVVGGRAYLPDSETTRHMIQQTAPVLRLYARQMGVSPSLVDVANDVPHTTVRNLSSSELARYSLVTQPRHPRATTAHKARRQRSR